MRHDPQRATAAYLAGELPRRARARFERHLLDCEHCWREANTARAGRTLAESVREVAPSHVRERVRAIADLTPVVSEAYPDSGRRRSDRRFHRWPYLLVGATAAVLLAVFALVAPWDPAPRQDQPAPLTAAARLFQATETPPSGPEPEPPRQKIAGYEWHTSTEIALAGIPATVHTYTEPGGRRLLIISSSTPFPRAVDAREIEPAPSWITDIDDAILLCADQDGTSWLAVAATTRDALAAGRSLGLTTE